ncbi:hypothetical protein [Ochrobactrum sp. EDr1-4]|uniref:hypothetical protein n=1 Tax=Ochrobactrum sp. EDr1-4 TaxID=3368622 RepID=UPI003B9F5CE3
MGFFNSDKELDAYERRQRMLDNAAPHLHTAIIMNENTAALLSELRFIRWLLIAILAMLITFGVHFLPKGWWYQGWLFT